MRMSVVIEPDGPDELIDAVLERLRARTVGAAVNIEIAETGAGLSFEPDVDAVIALAGSAGADLAESLAEPRRRSIPIAVLALDADREDVADSLLHPLADTLGDDDVEDLVDGELPRWLVDRLPEKRIALAHNFPFVRRAVARDAVRATALQNALIGGVVVIPGADMPLMTANQAKMLLQIAAAYGERMGAERVAELASVVGGGFAFRALARQMLSFVPGFGWAVKAGVGYTGTIAMGETAIAYFESGADLLEVANKLVVSGEKAARRGAMALKRVPRLGHAPSPEAVGEDTESEGRAGATGG